MGDKKYFETGIASYFINYFLFALAYDKSGSKTSDFKIPLKPFCFQLVIFSTNLAHIQN